MKRIGVAASKIAKDNLFLYNLYVILLSFLFSMLIFFLSGFSIIIGLAIISYATKGLVSLERGGGLYEVFSLCMAALAVVVGLVNLAAILLNFKTKK